MREAQETLPKFAYKLRNRSGGRRTEICETALLLFQQKGYTLTSVQNIADVMAVNKATLYHYFSSKEEVLYELIRVIFDLALSQMTDIRNSSASGAEKVRRIFETQFNRIYYFRGHVTVFYREQKHLSAEHAKQITRRKIDTWRCMKDILDEARESHEFRDVDPLALRVMLQSLVDHAYVWYRPEGARSPSDLAQCFADVLMRGLLPR